MKSRIQFFKDSQFKSEDSEAAAIFSILMDEEFQHHSHAKNEFLKTRLTIAGVVGLVGLALLFIPLYPVAIALLVGAGAAALYFYRQYQGKSLTKYIERIGKFHWKVSLFPYRDGCVAIDASGFHDAKDLRYPFLDDAKGDTLVAHRKEFSQIADSQNLFLDELDQGDGSKPFAYYGSEKQLKEILEDSYSILNESQEKSVSGPVLPATSVIDSNLIDILKNLEAITDELTDTPVSIQEHDATATYEALIKLDSFLSQHQEMDLPGALEGWIDELKAYINGRNNGSSQKGLADFREEFLSHCDAPGYNHYCPECNKNYNAEASTAASFTFDENSRMFLKLPGKWQCPVCGHSTGEPIKILRVYDEVIYPVARLLMLDEKAGAAPESLLNQILSPEFDRRLRHDKDKGAQAFAAVFDNADQAMVKDKIARFEELVAQLEGAISAILGKRRQVEEEIPTFKVDLSIPNPLHIHLPFYVVTFGGEQAEQGIRILTPASLVKSRDSESAVNYKFEQNALYQPYKDAIRQKMTELLKDKKYRVGAVKDQKQISRGMQKIKDTDFYSEHRDQFFDFIDKTYFQGQEN